MNSDAIVSLIAVAGSLVLATSALRAQQLPLRARITFAVIWGMLILGLMLIIQLIGKTLIP